MSKDTADIELGCWWFQDEDGTLEIVQVEDHVSSIGKLRCFTRFGSERFFPIRPEMHRQFLLRLEVTKDLLKIVKERGLG